MYITINRQSTTNKTNIISHIFIEIAIIINDKQELDIIYNPDIIIFINKNKPAQRNFVPYSAHCIRVNNELHQRLYSINKIKRFVVFIIIKICIELY